MCREILTEHPLFVGWLEKEADKARDGEPSALQYAYDHLTDGVPVRPTEDALLYLIVDTFESVKTAREAVYFLNIMMPHKMTKEDWRDLLLEIPVNVMCAMMELSEDPGSSWYNIFAD